MKRIAMYGLLFLIIVISVFITKEKTNRSSIEYEPLEIAASGVVDGDYYILNVSIENKGEQEYNNLKYSFSLNDDMKTYIASMLVSYDSEEFSVVSKEKANSSSDNAIEKPVVSGINHEWEMLLTTEKDLKEYDGVSRSDFDTLDKEITIHVVWDGGSQDETIKL